MYLRILTVFWLVCISNFVMANHEVKPNKGRVYHSQGQNLVRRCSEGIERGLAQERWI